MRKLFTILIALLLTATVWAQAPQKMSYQAVIRNSSNNLVTNSTVGMCISVLQYSASGSAVYAETQTPTTNANGLVSLEIGSGTVISGNFSTIDWQAGPYFIKTETDPAGGKNYTITGTSQLLSVPYALYTPYAKKAESYADGDFVLDYVWAGNLNSNNPAVIAYTTETWKGDRKIMMNGYVHLEFDFPQEAIDKGINEGTANVDMYLKYNGQTIMPVCFKHIKIMDNAHINLPLIALIPNSIAGNSMQFSLEGAENASKTDSAVFPPNPPIVSYPIDVRVSVVFSWVEL